MVVPRQTQHAHPAVFLFLILPFGAITGYLSVALAWELSRAGMNAAEIGALVAASYLPHTWKFVWAPIVDTTLTRKGWYLLGSLVTAVGMYGMGAVPANATWLPWLYAVVILANLASTFVGMAVESLVAHGARDDVKGRASGWFQAGNLGGGGLGGGAGLWMIENLPDPWMSGAVLGVVCALCSIGLFFLPEPPPLARSGRLGRDVVSAVKDVWRVARTRLGVLALLICFLPIGTGAASNLWSAVADDWHATADTVALVTGVLGGIVSAVGCLVGGHFCDRMDRKRAYVLYGLLQAGCAVAMAFAPRTESMYVVFTMVYAFTQGLTYAAFSAVVFEAIGLGAAATKYNVFASRSNMPIAYMTTVEGWAHTQWGASGLLHSEAMLAVAALLVFVAVAAMAPRRPVRVSSS
jgi:MFS family permease